jgi:glycosyltransferase involved in cell wall biosynthesis
VAAVEIIVEQLRRRVPGGIGTYTRGLLQGLHTLDADVTLFATGPVDDAYPQHTTRIPAPLLTRLWDRGVAVGPRGPLIHAVSLATPYPRGSKVVVVVHDTAWRTVPDAYPRRGRRWHEAALRRAVRRAAAIVAPSPIDGIDAVVIPEGADHLPPPDHNGAGALLRANGVTTPYVLTVSTLEPRKNLVRLVEAYRLASSRLPEPWPLLVAGADGWGAALQPESGVKLLGHVSGGVLAALYADARCLVYVPLLEGWGLPPVEAMRAGTPVVASPMPSTASAALEVEPTDVPAIANALVRAAGDDRVRSQLVTAGLERTRDLTWEATARQHMDLWSSLR